jgi:DNA-directed RNA polymerase specialized sigma24 family protein
MNSESERLNINPATAGEAGHYAIAEEVDKALRGLTDDDYIKLMLIARSFCKSRRLSISVMEPQELLAEAFAKTLQLEKKWNKRVSIIKHLDRAMENISGHLVRKRKKIDTFPEGLEPNAEQRGPHPMEDGADEALMRKEEIRAHLKAVFGADTEAANVFSLRTEGFQAAEIQSNLGLPHTKYEAIARRIRRKIALYLNLK